MSVVRACSVEMESRILRLNPIEQVFAKLKTLPRKADERTITDT
jgi:hypothetical protein